MKFRPCIDIHNGVVKQIIGGSLNDYGDTAKVNFTSTLEADYYANLYKKDGLKGGHIILLNPSDSPYYEATKEQAIKAMRSFPKGLQIGGGITEKNAEEYIQLGASHVIVTSYVFQEGQIKWERLEKLVEKVGKKQLVLDLSCRKKADAYYIMTDRWQRYTEVQISTSILKQLASYCDEFLIHGVDVEGKAKGVEKELVSLLGTWEDIPITYAGGIGNLQDLKEFQSLTNNKVDFTIGSALDLFGGNIPYNQIKSL